jgi:hypothetical protein
MQKGDEQKERGAFGSNHLAYAAQCEKSATEGSTCSLSAVEKGKQARSRASLRVFFCPLKRNMKPPIIIFSSNGSVTAVDSLVLVLASLLANL